MFKFHPNARNGCIFNQLIESFRFYHPRKAQTRDEIIKQTLTAMCSRFIQTSSISSRFPIHPNVYRISTFNLLKKCSENSMSSLKNHLSNLSSIYTSIFYIVYFLNSLSSTSSVTKPQHKENEINNKTLLPKQCFPDLSKRLLEEDIYLS